MSAAMLGEAHAVAHELMNLIQSFAGLVASRKFRPLRTTPARAFYKISDFKIKPVSRLPGNTPRGRRILCGFFPVLGGGIIPVK